MRAGAWGATGLVLIALVAGGCQPESRARQEEALRAVAAEGALLARDAADGSSTGVFTRVHAQALRKEAEALTLAAEAEEVADELTRLAASPTDSAVAREVAETLEDVAE